MAASACREERGLNQGHAEAAVDVWGLTVLAMSSSSLGGASAPQERSVTMVVHRTPERVEPRTSQTLPTPELSGPTLLVCQKEQQPRERK